MLGLEQNKQTIYYSLYQGSTDKKDAHGNYTGEKEVSYSTPLAYRLNVSFTKGAVDVSRGQAHLEEYGIDTNYVAVLVTTNMNCPIVETSVLWIGRKPYDENDVAVPYNYTVIRRLPSLNSITFVCREVDVK